MSQLLSGMLLYGFYLDEEDFRDQDGEEKELEYAVAEAWGFEERQEAVKFLRAEGILMHYPGTDDWHQRILAVFDYSSTDISGGYLGQEITTQPTWRDALKDFCERAGIKFKEPEWLLCASYG